MESDMDRETQRLEQQRKGDRRTITLLVGFIVGLFVVAVVADAIVIGSSPGRDQGAADGGQSAQPVATQPAPPPPAAAGGDQLFAENCGSCHTLAAAGTSGTIGPNLDDLAPDQALVLATVQNGAGGGLMPANLLTGAQAEQVAAFVAANAGH